MKRGIAFDCEIPVGCRIDSFYCPFLGFLNQKTSIEGSKGIRCEISEGFRFRFNSTQPVIPNNSCEIWDPNLDNLILKALDLEFFEFAWPANRLVILDSTIDLEVMIRYSKYFKRNVSVNLVNLKGVDLNIMRNLPLMENSLIDSFSCINCKLDFYNQGKLMRSCRNIVESGNPSFISLFQLSQLNPQTAYNETL